jgi:hypothetical protein
MRIIIEEQGQVCRFQSVIPRIGKQTLSAAGIATRVCDYNFNPIVSNERQYHVFEDVKKEVHILWAFLLSH